MKTRSKLLLAAVSLLTVSVAATATSAYAWYTANRQTKASLTNVEVRSTETSIKVSLVTAICAIKLGSEISITWINKSASIISSKVVLNALINGVGKLEINPTVSVNRNG